MAYVLPKEDEEKQQQAPGVMAPTPTLGGAGSSPLSMPAQPASGSPGKGTGFVSWDRILNANQDAAKKAAEKVSANIRKQVDAAKQGVQQAESAFEKGMAEGSPYMQGDAAAGVVGAREERQTVNGFGQPTATPTPKPTDRQILEQDAKGKYTGPMSLEDVAPDWKDILAKNAEASRRAGMTTQRDSSGNLRGDAGLEAVLRESGKGYTQGQSNMDAGLLGRAGRRDFEEIRKTAAQSEKDAMAANEKAKGRAATAKQIVDDRAAAAQAKIDEENKRIADGFQAMVDDTMKQGAEAQKKADDAALLQGRMEWDDTYGNWTNDEVDTAMLIGMDKDIWNSLTADEYRQFLAIREGISAGASESEYEAWLKDAKKWLEGVKSRLGKV